METMSCIPNLSKYSKYRILISMLCDVIAPFLVVFTRVRPSQGHRIYFIRVRSGSGQDIMRHYRVEVPQTLPRRTLSLISAC